MTAWPEAQPELLPFYHPPKRAWAKALQNLDHLSPARILSVVIFNSLIRMIKVGFSLQPRPSVIGRICDMINEHLYKEILSLLTAAACPPQGETFLYRSTAGIYCEPGFVGKPKRRVSGFRFICQLVFKKPGLYLRRR